MGFLSTVFISVAYIFVYISDFFFFCYGLFLIFEIYVCPSTLGIIGRARGGRGGALAFPDSSSNFLALVV